MLTMRDDSGHLPLIVKALDLPSPEGWRTPSGFEVIFGPIYEAGEVDVDGTSRKVMWKDSAGRRTGPCRVPPGYDIEHCKADMNGNVIIVRFPSTVSA